MNKFLKKEKKFHSKKQESIPNNYYTFFGDISEDKFNLKKSSDINMKEREKLNNLKDKLGYENYKIYKDLQNSLIEFHDEFSIEFINFAQLTKEVQMKVNLL